MKKRPDIIIINPDEMRWDSMGHAGNRAALTPCLDQFVREEAVSFSHAFCQNPVCVPSRCSSFTGLYPHVHGHRTMSYLLHEGEPSVFSELKKSGYYVFMNDRNDLAAGQIHGLLEEHADEIYYGENIPPAPGPIENLRGEPGNGFYYSHFGGRLGLDANGRNYSRDDAAVDAAIHRIKNRKDDRPLCIFLGLMLPHVPYQIEEPYYSGCDRSLLPPRVKFSDCSGKPAMMQAIHQYAGTAALSEKEWDEIRAVYLGMCRKVDDLFSRILSALKEAGTYDDSAIFFLSDHGDFAGDYDLPEKAQNTFEDCLTRVPFIVKPPKGEGVDPGVSDSMTELIDFYATVMDYAGVIPSHTHFGKSLRPIIKNRKERNRDYVFCEGGRLPAETHCDEFHDFGPRGMSPRIDYYPKGKAQTDPAAHEKAVMIRSDQYKLVFRSITENEFYDLTEDPQEKINRIHDTRYREVIAEMKESMLKWLISTDDIVPFERDSRFNPKMLFARAVAIASPDDFGQMQKMFQEGRPFVEIMQFARESSKKRNAEASPSSNSNFIR